MLCFEVTINDGQPVLAGHSEISVLSATASYVASRAELKFELGGLISRSSTGNEHLYWFKEALRQGDTVVLRIVESEEVSDPVWRRAEDPELLEKARRRYYERLKEEDEGKSG